MGPLGVVEPDPFADDPLGVEAVGQFVQVNRLVLERAPQSLNEDVVHAPAAPVHGDRDPGLLEATGDLEAGELAALVGVEDLRPAGGVERLIQGLDAEAARAGIGLAVSDCFMCDPIAGLERVLSRQLQHHMEVWLVTHAEIGRSVRIRVLFHHIAAAFQRDRDLFAGEAQTADAT